MYRLNLSFEREYSGTEAIDVRSSHQDIHDETVGNCKIHEDE